MSTSFRSLFFLGWIFPALRCVVGGMTGFDRVNWHKAIQIYIDNHPDGKIQSYRTTLDTYKHVPSLEEKALTHAKSHGVIPIASYDILGDSNRPGPMEKKIYFSSLIKPGDPLQREMGLHDETAFAFWKHEAHKTHLIQIDTLGPASVDWHLIPLEQGPPQT